MFNMSRVLLLAGMRLGLASAMDLMPSTVPLQRGQRPSKIKRGFHRNRTTLHATNGKRECARRRRQIAEGRLRHENGLEV